MPLYKKRRLKRPGLPELVALAVLAAAAVTVIAWVNSATAPDLRQTLGAVTSCEIRLTHYNATALLPKVSLNYTYSAGIGTYSGHWEGFWPATESPDALHPDQLDQLKTAGRTITVFYDPANPATNTLHSPSRRTSALFAVAAMAAVFAAGVYLLRIYPVWKR